MRTSRIISLSLSLLSPLLTQTASALPLEAFFNRSHVPAEALGRRSVARNGDPGYIGPGTYPRAFKLHDGSLLACYTRWPGDGTQQLTTARSYDGGWNWTPVGSVATEPQMTRDLDNCYIHQLPNGRLLAAFRNHDRNSLSGGPWYYYRLVMAYSDNNGNDWVFLNLPAESPTPGLGLWEPFMLDGLDGSLMLFYSRETNVDGSDQDSIMKRSYDGGVTWGAEQTISGGGRQGRDGMQGVVRMDGSNLMAVFESLDPDVGITSVTSSDDGHTWGNRRTVYKSTVSGSSQGAPQISKIANKLVVSFQTNEDNTGNTDLSSFNAKVVTSTDGGASWGEKTTVLDHCIWPGQVVIDNTHLLVMCDAYGAALAQTMNIS